MFKFGLKKRIFLGSLLGLCSYNGYAYSTFLESKNSNHLYDQSAIRNINSKEFTYKLKTRNEHLEEIKQTSYDVVIIGGGATGSGIALECAQRGLRSLLIESEDFASGASSKSTKLVHGGLRYLQQVFEVSLQGDRWVKLKLVIGALRERSTFLTISQIHTKELPILIPCTSLFQALYFYSGTMLYHLIYKIFADTNTFQFSAPRIVQEDEIKLYYKQAQCQWGLLFSDGQFNDSRMVQELLVTSTLQKYHNRQNSYSNIINYSNVFQLTKNESGQLCGLQFKDNITNQIIKVDAKAIINSTGCYADSIRLMDNPTIKKRIVLAGGSHIVLPAQYGSRKWGFLTPSSDGRVLFILPWLSGTLVGTTEKFMKEPVKAPTVSDDEFLWLVSQYSHLFPEIKAEQIVRNVKSKWCGIRPLVHDIGYGEEEIVDTKKVSRQHTIEVSKSGLISVMGGKWTIYRQMSEDAVNEIFKQFELKGLEAINLPSISKQIKLVGEFERGHRQPNQNRKGYIIKYANLLSQNYQIPIKDAKYFIKTYGERSFDIFKLNQEDPEYKDKIHPSLPHTVGEIVYLIRYEMAQKPQDIIFRRTRIGFLDSRMIYNVYPKISEIYAKELNWTEEEKKEFLKSNLDNIRSLGF